MSIIRLISCAALACLAFGMAGNTAAGSDELPADATDLPTLSPPSDGVLPGDQAQLSAGRLKYVQGLRSLKENDFRRAIVFFSDAIASGELSPRFRSEAHYFRGRALTRLSRSELALLEFTRAVDYWPENIKALRTRCRALTLADRLDEAQKDCDRAIFLDAEDWRAWFTRGVLYDARRQPKLAKVDYAQAQARGPKNLTDIPYVADRFRDHGLIKSFYTTPAFSDPEQ